MLITIYHNEFHKELEIKEDDSMGYLLEKFLQCCNLLIYNIEYCIVTLNKNKEYEIQQKNENNEENHQTCSFILGSNELPFSLTIQSTISMMKAFSIERFELIDRKRDEHGNVIKNNVYLDEYQKWYQERESTNYIEYMNNQPQYVENNRNQFINVFQEFNQQLHDQLHNQTHNQVSNLNSDNLQTEVGTTGTSFLENNQENSMQGPMFLFQNIMNNYNQNNTNSNEEFSDDDEFEDNEDENNQDINIIEDIEALDNNNVVGNNNTSNANNINNTTENDEIENEDDDHRNLNNHSEVSSTLPQNNRNPYQTFIQNLNSNPSYQEFSNQLLQNLSQSNFQDLYNQTNQQQIPNVHFYMPTVLGSHTLPNPNINIQESSSNLYNENPEEELENNNESSSTLSNNNENIDNNENIENNHNNIVNNNTFIDQNQAIRNNENLNQSNNLNFQQFNQQVIEQFTNELRNNIMTSFSNSNNEPLVQYIDIINHLDIPVYMQEQNLENVIVALTDQEFQNLEKKIYKEKYTEKYTENKQENKQEICTSVMKEKINNEDKNMNESTNNTCFICLDNFQEKDEIIILSCKHNFHYICIENWLKNHSNKCPTCREVVANGEPKNL